MLVHRFSHVTTWVFDLDNTLYPPEQGLFDQIEVLMTDWVMNALGVDRDEADRLRLHYWETYGTTLAGLMAEHDLDPVPYLDAVHDISFAPLVSDPDLAAQIGDLPGRRVIYTNATVPYAERVIEARGLSGLFDAIYGVEEAGYHAKPNRQAFETVFARDGFDPLAAAMFEDDPRNLAVPHAMGMQTVHVAGAPVPGAHIHHHTTNLSDFLSQLSDLAPLRSEAK
ncbi:pyrimidine 5'-nucleotidase [Maritimibacter dapengensis]|uniref:Pyrimidine 5'-nucleotidase n=1 Tax=Maritimibacter dapengensis TaxID=2836868 RepID=A0ABS6T2D2_9RHOB|nr:pyrimidine 5'-nucleotidase [Maritimibacter dapengensis]MBV7378701.1 pyrimidine 5'-nucleotidase [Maritimibacter dapengensis]